MKRLILEAPIHSTRVSLLACVCFLASLIACTSLQQEHPIELPAQFDADRIFINVALHDGDTLNLYTDTGGGLFIFGHVADRLGWQDSASVAMRDVASDSGFPEPLGTTNQRIPIFRPPDGRQQEFDGMLGQGWFAGRIWTFDYTARKLLLHRALPGFGPGTRAAELGFLTDSTGVRMLSFPRISVVVDGDTLEMLFDTGAMVHLATTALEAMEDSGPAVRATSFITSEIFNRWREHHPGWKVLPNADENVNGVAMIEVPEVSLAGFTVGPIWFTERPNANFHEFMSQWMDRRVDGALGGNLFRFFRITVDYPGAMAYVVPAGDTH